MKNNNSIKINYIYNVSYQMLTLITPLITTPYLSRILKADNIGLYSFTASLVQYFVMFATLGTVNYGNREISYHQDNREKRSVAFWEIELLSIISSAVCLAAYIVFTLFIYSQYTSLLLIQAFSLVNVAANITWFFQGLEQFRLITFRNILFRIINVAFIFTAIHTTKDLFLYVAGMCLIELVSNISMWLYVPKFIDRPHISKLRPFRHLKPTILLFLPTIATSIYTVMDKTMLTELTGSTTENGYYDQAANVYKMALTVVTALGTVMIPRIGKYYSERRDAEVFSLLYKSYRFVWFIGLPMCFGLIGISRNFAPWFYGVGYEKVPYLLMIQAILIPVIGISNVTGIQYFLTTKQENFLTRSVFLGAIVNFILNLLLIPRLLSYGASTASVISELFITLIQLWYARKALSVRKIFQQSCKYFISSLVMLLVLLAMDSVFVSGIIYTFVMVAVGFIVYILTLLLLQDSFLIEFTRKFLEKTSKISR